jgi:hypothetical protein
MTWPLRVADIQVPYFYKLFIFYISSNKLQQLATTTCQPDQKVQPAPQPWIHEDS